MMPRLHSQFRVTRPPRIINPPLITEKQIIIWAGRGQKHSLLITSHKINEFGSVQRAAPLGHPDLDFVDAAGYTNCTLWCVNPPSIHRYTHVHAWVVNALLEQSPRTQLRLSRRSCGPPLRALSARLSSRRPRGALGVPWGCLGGALGVPSAASLASIC